ncbi:PapB/FocB family fimbrial expression transcriptional regulator [Escherichia coli]|uniref:PapB/FocB family fimbrial expression transcriptional regulator n=1 Tax=Escherichia coli TaxID=562 RepID=UPI0028798CD9|nr:PapB/FocB family fimbrial expression transcriptional regulator [Escherichia coli]MDS1619815.1 PapB/FocB family fimbrial expression transcriptional regulator [Escherichia coli]
MASFEKIDEYDKELFCGEVDEMHFYLLVAVSSIHSKKIILAMKDYLVCGYSRKTVCEMHNVNNGYLSISLARLRRIHYYIKRMIPFYNIDENWGC